MWYRRFLMCVICLISGFVLIGKAEAGLAWFGFSQLCFEYDDKGGKGDGILEITIQDIEVLVACEQITNAEGKCQQGNAHNGGLVVEVPVEEAGTGKDKGIVNADGCISLDRYDIHGSDGHVHSCKNGSHWQEVPGSARVNSITVEWRRLQCANQDCTQTKVVKTGNQVCNWQGTFNVDSCQPEHETTFDCIVDNEVKVKGKN